MLITSFAHGSHKPMVMIDIAVPRDIDPRVGEVDGIHLFDMDDLERGGQEGHP